MRIAVLGGRGVIGGFIAKALSTKHTVTAITRDVVDLMNADAVANYFSKHTFDVVINAAVNPTSNLDADAQVAVDNLTLFTNMYAARNSFGRVIQLCSGAEFDRRYSIDEAHEDAILTRVPRDPYGMSKNVAARLSLTTENFYNLRLFGVFYAHEAPTRLLPRILANQSITLEDRYFDFLYLEDILPVVEHYVNTAIPVHKDMNVVYAEKILLSDFVEQFCRAHNLSGDNITYDKTNRFNYTGNAERYISLDLPQLGIEVGIKRYR